MYVLASIIVIVSISTLRSLEQQLLVRVPAYGGTIIEGDLGSPRYINPLLALTDADRDITALTYAGLMGFSANGKLSMVLAKKYTVSSNGKIYTFTLRKNARFSDGTPVTAADVVFTVQKAQDPALKSPWFQDWHGVIASAVNAYTVRFTLPQPYEPFLQNTTMGILPKYLWKNISDAQFPFSKLIVSPVGAGPFMVKRIVRDKNSGLILEYDVTASKNYVFGRPYLNGIDIRFYSNASNRNEALAQGKIESAYGVIGNNSDERVVVAPSSSVFGVFFNENKYPILVNKEIRKALSIAINRNALIHNVLNGNGFPIMGPVPPGMGVKQTAIPSGNKAIKNAANILEQAGWVYNGNAREWKNKNKKLTFSSITVKTSNISFLHAISSVIRKDWQKLGISVNIELYESGDLNQNVIRPRDYQALLFGVAINHGQDIYAFWDSSQRTNPGLNIALYANKTVDNLLEDARTTENPKKRTTDLNLIEKDISADYPAVFLYTPKFIYTVPNNLRGIALPVINTPSNRFATVAQWYTETNLIWPFLSSKETY